MPFQCVESASGSSISPVLLSIIVSPSIAIFFEVPPMEFSHCIFHQLLIIHMLISDLLLLKFIQTCHTDRGIWTKNNLFVPCDVIMMASSSSSFVFIQFRRGTFNFLGRFNNDVHYLLLVLWPQSGYKKPLTFTFYTSKNPSSSLLSMLHCWFSASVYLFTLQHIPGDDNFYLVCIQNQSLMGVIWNILTMKICLYAFFPRFQLAIDVSSLFIGSVNIFSNNCDSISFQIFLYWVFQASSSETLNDIV